MPRTLTYPRGGDGGYSVTTQVATEGELLDFANSIRKAGGANALEALIPSIPQDANSCLIANALNFGCRVVPREDVGGFKDGSQKWVMELPDSLTSAQRAELAKVDGVRLTRYKPMFDEEHIQVLTLPKHIGNAADAFDSGAAFQDLVQNPRVI